MYDKDEKLQLDTAIEAEITASAIQLVDPDDSRPHLRHPGATNTVTDELAFMDRTIEFGALILSKHLTAQAKAGFKLAVERNVTYKDLTPEIGALCLAIIERSHQPELELVANLEPNDHVELLQDVASQAA